MNTHSHSNGHHSPEKGGHSCCASTGKQVAGTAATVIDPVCGMQVDPLTTAHHAVHADAKYHFCSARCRERFIADPAKYLSPSAAFFFDDAAAAEIYTLALHVALPV